MWLTEVLGRMRGEVVQLHDNPATPWQCDPHVKVHLFPWRFLFCSPDIISYIRYPSSPIVTTVECTPSGICNMYWISVLSRVIANWHVWSFPITWSVNVSDWHRKCWMILACNFSPACYWYHCTQQCPWYSYSHPIQFTSVYPQYNIFHMYLSLSEVLLDSAFNL